MSAKTTQHTIDNQLEVDRLSSDLQNDIMVSAKKILKDYDINFTMKLSDSAKKETDNQGFKTLTFDSPYGVPVEFGMPAGIRVNVDELKKWVMGKLGVSDEKEAEDVAWKIRYKILHQGIKQTRFLKKAIKFVIGQRGIPDISIPSAKKTILDRLAKYSKIANRFSKKAKKAVKNFKSFKDKYKP